MSATHDRRALVALTGLVAVVAWLAWRQAGHSVAEPGAPAPQAAWPSEVSASTREGQGAGEGARASLLRSNDGPTLDELRSDPDFRAGLASVTGRCVDPRGTPLVGVRVEVFSLIAALATSPGEITSRDLTNGAATAGMDGRFLIDGLHPGDDLCLFYAGDGRSWVMNSRTDRFSFLADCFCEIRLLSGQVTDLGDLVLTAGARVHGRLCDEQGRAIAGASIRAEKASDRHEALTAWQADDWLINTARRVVGPEPDLLRGGKWEAQASAQGEFHFAGLAPGIWTVAATPTARSLAVARRITVTSGQMLDLGDWPVATGRTLHGRVVDASGQPVSGCEVVVAMLRRKDAKDGDLHGGVAVRTDAAGRFEAGGLTAERATVAARPWPGLRWTIREGVDVATPVEMRLDPTHALDVRVTANGVPVIGVAFDLVPEEREPFHPLGPRLFPRPLPQGAAAEWSADGRARLAPLSPGRYRLFVEAEGYAPAVVDVAVPHEGVLEVQLSVGARRCRLEVVDAQGRPVRYASVEAAGCARPFHLWTDALGRCELPLQAKWPFDVWAWHPVHGTARLTLERPQPDARLALVPNARLELRLEAETPTDFRGWKIDAAPAGAAGLSVSSAFDRGGFACVDVRPDEPHDLSVWDARGAGIPCEVLNWPDGKVVAAPGQRLQLRLRVPLDPMERRIELRLHVHVDGTPARDLPLRLGNDEVRYPDAEGLYTLSGIVVHYATNNSWLVTLDPIGEEHLWEGQIAIGADDRQTARLDLRTGLVSGTLADASGAPAGGVAVSFRGRSHRSAWTDTRGRFEVRLVRGDYIASARYEKLAAARRVTVGAGATLDDLRLTLAPLVRVRGRVDLPWLTTRRPLRLRLTGLRYHGCRVANDGSFEVADVLPGTDAATLVLGYDEDALELPLTGWPRVEASDLEAVLLHAPREAGMRAIEAAARREGNSVERWLARQGLELR